MKSPAIIFGSAVSAVLVAVAGLLYANMGSGGQPYRESASLVREIQQLSSAWSIEVARVKSDPFADFDSLASFIPRMAQLREALSGSTRGIPELPERLASDVSAYLNALDAQEERIERFKTGHAVVRNSSRYFPVAAANVTQQAGSIRDQDLARSVSSLAHRMTSYLAAPTDGAKARLSDELQRLLGESVTYPTSLSNALSNLVAHAEVLLARQEPVEKLFQDATSNEITGIANRLAGDLEFEQGKREMHAAFYQRGIAVVLAVLTLLWIVLAVLQRVRGGANPVPSAAPGLPSPTVDPDARPVRAAKPRKAAKAAKPRKAGKAAKAAEPASVPSAAAAEGGEPIAVTEDEAEPAAEPEETFTRPRSEAPAAAREEAAPAAAASAWPEAAASREAGRGAAGDGSIAVESRVLHGFLAECVAEALGGAADRITARMDRQRLSQDNLRITLEDRDADPDSFDGIGFDEEIEALAAAASSVRREANGLADLARRLGSFSKVPDGAEGYEMVDVNACIDEVIEAVGAEARGVVARNFGNVPRIFASKAEIRLLLSKFVENSMLATRGLDGRAGVIKLDTASRNGEILITIIDNGVGIAADRHKKIFEPFYTTREDAMGVGLTLADRLVGKYKGAIALNSLPGHGTVIRITLPAAGPPAS